MKSLIVGVFCLLLFASCSNEEVLPYEVPLVTCVETSPYINIDKLSNELGTIKQRGTADSPSFVIVVEGGLFTQNKTYGVCNLPTTLEKDGQKIRFEATKMTINHPGVNAIPILSLTNVKLVK